MMILRCAALVVALAGCSKVLGFKEVTAGDGGIDGSTDAGMLVAPPNTVVGRIYAKCRQASGDVELPTDLSQTIIQALIFDESKRAYRTAEGAGKADGTFRIDDVPDGVTYLFRFGSSYYETDQHVLDLSSAMLRRCAPVPNLASSTTPIAWKLTGMTPFQSGFVSQDDFHIVSFSLAYYSALLLFFQIPDLNPGSTVFQPQIYWGSGTFGVLPAPLVDASQDDDLFVFHVRGEGLSGLPVGRRRGVQYLLDLYKPTGITLQNGVAISIEGAFQPIPRTKSVRFTIDRAVYDAGYSGASEFRELNVSIMATPALDDLLSGKALARFGLGDISRSTDLRDTIAFQYGDPFPASWKRYSVIEYTRARSFKPPGASFSSNFVVSHREVAEFTTAINATPVLQPPRSAKIGGVDFDAGGKVAFDGTSPVEVSWTPVLSAKSYRLSISRVSASGRQPIATVRTANTSLKLPAELLSGSQFFAFALAAVRSPNDYPAGHVVQSGLPTQVAEAPSGLFRFSNDCGDGVVKAGEESCDTKGESATCDVDCTMPECGDGLRNAAAGEACDSAADTLGCNANCTLSVCGDGHINFNSEDCDDGNTVDSGNGCSSECKFNNICGNDHVESLVEECDPGSGGETAMCDSDCTIARCGDEHVNAAAGEECDDGLANGNSHCSRMCKLVTP